MLPLIFIALVLIALKFPDLPVGRALHKQLIAQPARWLNETSPVRVALMIIVLCSVVLAGAELNALLAGSEYGLIPWALDVSVYLEALLVISVAVARMRIKSVVTCVAHPLRRMFTFALSRPRARSPHQKRGKLPATSSEERIRSIFLTAQAISC